MFRKFLFGQCFIFILMLLTACSSTKKLVYLQNMQLNTSYAVNDTCAIRIHINDRLNIRVSCKTPELAIPFNTQNGTFRVATDGNIQSQTTNTSTANSYRVDDEGMIIFPILGKLNVEGLTTKALSELIANRIMAENYIRDPQITVEILNFKYTVLGAVNHCGAYTVDGDHVTLLDAIAFAGDLSKNARIDRVAVIRDVNGKREIYMHDLRQKEIFDSPCFYLQQNDIVYVQPRYGNKTGEERALQYGTLGMSIMTAVCTLLYVLK